MEEKVKTMRVYTEEQKARKREYSRIRMQDPEKKAAKQAKDRVSGMSEERLERKRARDRERVELAKVDADLKERRILSSRKYHRSNRDVLARKDLDKRILTRIGKSCPIVVVRCRECGKLETKKEYKSRQGKASLVYCSLHTRKHSHKGEFVHIKKTPKICPDCGVLIMGIKSRKTCDPCRKRRNRDAQRYDPKVLQRRKETNGSHRKRARINGGIYETVNKRIVFDRDKWRCVECGVKVVRSKEWMPNQATIDHTIPLSRGGLHTYGNVRTMCMMCNSKKCDTMPSGVQLTIFERV